MRLTYRDGSTLPLARTAAFSAAWGLGVGGGVALGAVLTAMSGAGAPGLTAVDVTADLLRVPAIVGGAVFAVHLAFTLAFAAFRGRRASEHEADEHESDEGEGQHGVEGQVGAEVPAAQG